MEVRVPNNTVINDLAGIAEVFGAVLNTESEVDRDKEHFWIVGLNTRNNIKYIELVSLGTLNASLVHPREVYRMAIMKASSSIIIVHNHPSGDPEPSEEDGKITARLANAGNIIGIQLLDHVVIGVPQQNGIEFKSFKELGLI